MLKQATRFGAETVMTREDQNLQRVSSGYREAWPVLSFINILRFSSTKGRNNQNILSWLGEPSELVDPFVQLSVAPSCCLAGTVSEPRFVMNSAAGRVATALRAACGTATAPSSKAAPSAVNTE